MHTNSNIVSVSVESLQAVGVLHFSRPDVLHQRRKGCEAEGEEQDGIGLPEQQYSENDKADSKGAAVIQPQPAESAGVCMLS